MSRERYLMEYLHNLLAYDQPAGLRLWTDAFGEALRAWDTDRCRRLLAEIQWGSLDLSPRGHALAVNRYGQWLMQRGDWAEAIRRLEQSLDIFQSAEDILGEAQALSKLPRRKRRGFGHRSARHTVKATCPVQCLQILGTRCIA